MARSGNTPLYIKVQDWRNRWFIGPPEVVNDLRSKYGNNVKRYLAAFRLDDDDQMFLQERGMESFVRMEKRLLRQMRMRSVQLGGLSACEAFIAGIKSGLPSLTADSSFRFVSLDFEGSVHEWGIKEVGFTSFDTRDALQPTDSTLPDKLLHTTKYEVGRHKRKFLHGHAIRAHSDQLPGIIRNHLTAPASDNNSNPRKVVLVGHGIQNEIRELDEMGVIIEDIPGLVGVIDTAVVAFEMFGNFMSLGNLLCKLQMDPSENTLHCAGNDSNYTLRALLAMLYIRHSADSLEGGAEVLLRRLESIARSPIPSPVQKVLPDQDVPSDEDYGLLGDGGFDIFA